MTRRLFIASAVASASLPYDVPDDNGNYGNAAFISDDIKHGEVTLNGIDMSLSGILDRFSDEFGYAWSMDEQGDVYFTPARPRDGTL